MNYEEKYKEALEGIQEILDSGEDSIKMSRLQLRLQGIFPELHETGDEKIRKELISFFSDLPDTDTFRGISPSKVITWLEKQESVGEIVERCKKSWYNEGKIAGMAEGLTDDEKYQQGWYNALEKQGEKHPDPYNGISFEYSGHIWGMCARDNGVDISCDKHLIKHLEEQGESEKDILEDVTLDGNEDGLIAETIKYKNKKQSEKKPAWNKEDKGIIEEVVSYLINYSNIVESKEDADRIEYLIDKIQDICPYQKQEWSEEDEEHIDSLLKRLDALCRNKFERTRFAISEDIDWLKSLRPQNTWKPSNEQMEALDWQIENTSVGSWQYKATKKLLEDLKKLKEE